jgi:hypothetical protein
LVVETKIGTGVPDGQVNSSDVSRSAPDRDVPLLLYVPRCALE